MRDVAVLGDGLPELAAALELAEVGLRVRVYPHPSSDGAPGGDGAGPGEGANASHLTRDWIGVADAEGIEDPAAVLSDFLTHIATPLAPGVAATPDERLLARQTPASAPLLRDPNGAWAAQPTPEVWGIPAVPLSSDALALLGGRAAARAALDRVTPVLTIGKTHSFGALVRARLGQGALDRLVEPQSREAFGVPAADIDAAVIAPGLNEALTRAGSLSGAALETAERNVARETRIAPASGWSLLREELITRLRAYAVDFATAPAGEVTPVSGGWTVGEAGGPEDPEAAPATSVRALVRGVPERGLREPCDPAVAPLLDGARRVLAGIPIADPALPTAQPDGPAVETVRLQNGELWSVRVVRVAVPGGAEWEARVAGPAGFPDERGDPAARGHAFERVTEAVAAAGHRPFGEAQWMRMPVAPYATVQARETAERRLMEWCESHEYELPVGSALHGGDLPTALAHARERAILLRRRLTGIAD